jgi:membrane protein required for colicin V production
MLFLQVNPPPVTGDSNIDIVSIIFNLLIFMPLGWGAYKGYEAGLLSEIVGILHFAIAFAISFKITGFIIKLVNNNIFNFSDGLLAPVAFCCAVAGALALLNTLGKYMKTEIEYDFPGAWDNIIGAVVGLIKYAIILSFFFWFLSGFGKVTEDLKGNSVLYSTIEHITYKMMGVDGEDSSGNAKNVSDKIEGLL